MIPPVPEKTFDVAVTNSGKERLVDYFDGQEFEFPPGKTVTVPSNVARHIFGYGDADKEPHVVRLGWTITRKDLPEALHRLSKFKFDPPETRPSLSPGAERVPLNSPKGDGGKLVIQPAAA